MSKIIGKKELFAIQYEITNIEGNFIYGQICYWIKGQRVGDFEETTILSDAFCFLPHIINDNGNREHEGFYNMEMEKVHYLLGGQAYLDDYDRYERQSFEEMWARFNIVIGLDVFCGAFAVLIDGKNNSRMIFSNNNSSVEELYLEKGFVDDIFWAFNNDINELYDNPHL